MIMILNHAHLCSKRRTDSSLALRMTGRENLMPAVLSHPFTLASQRTILMNEVTLTLLNAEAQRGRLTIWVGGELPASLTGVPDRQTLANELALRYQLPATHNTLAVTAQQIGQLRYHDLVQFLLARLATTGREPLALDSLLARLPIAYLITTRYDDLIEKAFAAARRPLSLVVSDVDSRLRRSDQAVLVKLYGDLRQPASLTITQDDLYRLAAHKQDLFELVLQAAQGTLLLLGHDLVSPDFLLLWLELTRRLARFAPVAYAAVERPLSEQERQLWRERNIELVDASALEVLQRLGERLGLTPGASSEPALSPPPEPPVQAYRNFDLELSRQGAQLRVRLLRSPAGEATAWVSDFGAWLPELAQIHTLEGWGEEIGARLLPGVVAERWAASLALVTTAQAGLRLRLFIDEDDDLASVPWEAAQVGGSWLGLRPSTPMLRVVQVNKVERSLVQRGPQRLLVVLAPSAELGLPALDHAREQAALVGALTPLERQGKLQVRWLTGMVTRRELLDALRWQPHLLHFVGHGYFDEKTRAGGLVLGQVEAGGLARPDRVSATELAVLLDGTAMRFALLNACESGRAAGGVAVALVRAGVPAVLGMQANLPDDAAVRLAGAFYRAVADQWPVEAAATEARRLLALELGLTTPTWAQPILLSRSEVGGLDPSFS
jgi:hypothetical protein